MKGEVDDKLNHASQRMLRPTRVAGTPKRQPRPLPLILTGGNARPTIIESGGCRRAPAREAWGRDRGSNIEVSIELV